MSWNHLGGSVRGASRPCTSLVGVAAGRCRQTHTESSTLGTGERRTGARRKAAFHWLAWAPKYLHTMLHMSPPEPERSPHLLPLVLQQDMRLVRHSGSWVGHLLEGALARGPGSKRHGHFARRGARLSPQQGRSLRRMPHSSALPLPAARGLWQRVAWGCRGRCWGCGASGWECRRSTSPEGEGRRVCVLRPPARWFPRGSELGQRTLAACCSGWCVVFRCSRRRSQKRVLRAVSSTNLWRSRR